MPKVLFISYDGMTDPLGQSQVIPYLAGLSKHGYEFTVLSCEKKEKYHLYKKQVEEIIKPFSIKWVPLPYHKKPAVLSTIYDVYKMRKKAVQLHKKEKFDIIHTRPGIPALVGLRMKKKFEIKFLNDIREFYADSRIDGGIWNKENPFYHKIYSFFKQKENEAVEKSDGIVCLTYAAEKIIKQWPGYKTNIPLQVIPCSVDIELFNPNNIDLAKRTNLKAALKIKEDDFIISYLGSIGSWYLMEEMMQFFKMISDKNPKAKFLFISPNGKQAIEKEAQKFGVEKEKIMVKEAQRNEVPVLLSFSSFSVFFIKPCYSKQSSSPTKHGEIMAMGLPVISNAGVGDVGDIIEKYQSGIVLKELNKKEYDLALELIFDREMFNKNQIRNGAIEFYNLDSAVEKYKNVYDLMLKNHANA